MIRLFRVFVPVRVVTLLVLEVILIYVSFIAAAYLTLEAPDITLRYEGGLQRISVVALIIILGMYFHDLYSTIRIRTRILLVQQLCQVIGIALVLQGFISWISRGWKLGLRHMLFGSIFSMISIFVLRLFYSSIVLKRIGGDKILFVGGNALVRDIAGEIEMRPDMGLRVAGYVDDTLPPGYTLNGAKVLGPLSCLHEVTSELKPDRIVVGLSERRDRMPVNELLDLRFAGYVIEEAGATFEAVCGRICTKELRPAHLIFSGELGPRPSSVQFQTMWNFLVAGLGAIICLPLMLLIALAVKLSSPGPILYRQKRVGRDGVVFALYKFRSMYINAEEQTGAVWAVKDDPRVTPVGRILRQFRLDELPQLYNVLKGEMAIVGPRPERPEFVKTLSEQIPYYRQRHCVRPGITGWAQINHKYTDTLEDTITKLEYDLYYIKHMSFSLDAYIVFHTLKTILLKRGSQ